MVKYGGLLDVGIDLLTDKVDLKLDSNEEILDIYSNNRGGGAVYNPQYSEKYN